MKARKVEAAMSKEAVEAGESQAQTSAAGNVSLEATVSKSSASPRSGSEGRMRTRTKARKMETATSQEAMEAEETNMQKSQPNDVSTESRPSKSSTTASNDESRTLTRTKTRRMEGEGTSSDETMNTEETEVSMSQSHTQGNNHVTRSTARLSTHTPGKHSSADTTFDLTISSSTAATKSVTDDAAGSAGAKTSSVSTSEAISLAEVESKSVLPKSEEASRRDTHVITRAESLCPEEEEARPTRSTRTKTRQAQNQSGDSDCTVKAQDSVMTQQPAEEPRMTR